LKAYRVRTNQLPRLYAETLRTHEPSSLGEIIAHDRHQALSSLISGEYCPAHVTG
jgi:hypothetical protein